MPFFYCCVDDVLLAFNRDTKTVGFHGNLSMPFQESVFAAEMQEKNDENDQFNDVIRYQLTLFLHCGITSLFIYSPF